MTIHGHMQKRQRKHFAMFKSNMEGSQKKNLQIPHFYLWLVFKSSRFLDRKSDFFSSSYVIIRSYLIQGMIRNCVYSSRQTFLSQWFALRSVWPGKTKQEEQRIRLPCTWKMRLSGMTWGHDKSQARQPGSLKLELVEHGFVPGASLLESHENQTFRRKVRNGIRFSTVSDSL